MEKNTEYGSPFSLLPDDIVVEIYNKIMDLKTLCCCQLISKRFSLLIFQADTILFDVPLRFDYENERRFDDMKPLLKSFRVPIKETAYAGALDSEPALHLGSDSFPSAIKFIKRFTKLKFIHIRFPSYVRVLFGVSLFKLSKFETKAPYFLTRFLNYFLLLEEGSDEGRDNTNEDEDIKAYCCLMDAVDRLKKLLGCTVEFPLLEKLFITDSSERVTLSGGEPDELRNFLHSYGKHRLKKTNLLNLYRYLFQRIIRSRCLHLDIIFRYVASLLS